VRRRHLILVIRATGARRPDLPRTAVNVLVPASLAVARDGAATRAGDSAPGQTGGTARNALLTGLLDRPAL
jgi:hypothetical protein